LERVVGIPRIGPEAAALFRILLGCGVAAVLWFDDSIGRPDTIAIAYSSGTGYGTGTWAIAHWIRLHPAAHGALLGGAVVFALAYAAGVFTRYCAALLWASLFLLVSASLVTVGNHAWGAPLLALFGLLLAPLGEVWSVDAWRRRRRGTVGPPSAAGPAFGFAMWWIGLVLGSALLGAAYAKLSTSGLEWITGGAIRFHFVEDAGNALVPWGLWIAGHLPVAIAVSAAAILIEGTFILNILRRNDGYRALFGLAGLSLHLGFLLFQGVLWWPWILLYLAFLPWQAISRRLSGRAAPGITSIPRLSVVHAAAIAGVLAQQGYASFHAWEFEPLLSHYPMYAGTSPSWEAFFDTRRWSKYQRYTFVLTGPAGERLNLAEPVALVTPADRARLIDTLRALYSGIPADGRSTAALAALKQRIAEHVRREVDTIEIFVDVQAVNLEAMRIDTPVRNMHAFTLRLSPPTLPFVEPAFAGTFTGLCDNATVMNGTIAPGQTPPAPSAGRPRPAC
jgi:hypothetical protein